MRSDQTPFSSQEHAQAQRLTQVRRWSRCAGILFTILILLVATRPAAETAIGNVTASEQQATRHIGYGISVGPHLTSQPGMLDELGMDWVKLYDTVQIDDYPNQRVLYRVDMRGPQAWDAWERGLYDLARELQAKGVDAVEIGNEPNLGSEWGNQRPDARAFTDGLCRAYRAFKAVAPEIIIVSGGLAPTITTPDGMNITDLDYAQQMLDFGAGACFDAFGYHPYGFNQPPESDPYAHELTFRRSERMYRLLLENGVRDRQIWITEFGWVRDPAEEGMTACGNQPGFRDFDWMRVPAQVQADYTVRAFQFAERNWPWAGPMFLWNLNWNTYDASYESPCSHLRWYGILDTQGNKLPVYFAISNMVEVQPPLEQRPILGAIIANLTETVEAGCASEMRLGEFEVINAGYPGPLSVEIVPANAPGRPFVTTSATAGSSGTDVDVFVDATGVEPGLHLIVVNLRSRYENRLNTLAVRGWLLVHFPTSPECIVRFNNS
ncbi:MAG: hypothetical protein GYB68_03080 [Chloroflexi bacterium]|nr:hypothetical protein [Chloroflexota bacterium]